MKISESVRNENLEESCKGSETGRGPGSTKREETIENGFPEHKGENLEKFFRTNFGVDWATERFEEAYSEMGLCLFTDFAVHKVAAPHDMIHVSSLKLERGKPVVLARFALDVGHEYLRIPTNQLELVSIVDKPSEPEQSSSTRLETSGEVLPSWHGENLEAHLRRTCGEFWTEEALGDAYAEFGQLLLSNTKFCRVTYPHDELKVVALNYGANTSWLPEVIVDLREGQGSDPLFFDLPTKAIELVDPKQFTSTETRERDEPPVFDIYRPHSESSFPENLRLSQVWPEEWLPTWLGENLEARFRRKFGKKWMLGAVDKARAELSRVLAGTRGCCRVAFPHEPLQVKSLQIGSDTTNLPVIVATSSRNWEEFTIWTGEVELLDPDNLIPSQFYEEFQQYKADRRNEKENGSEDEGEGNEETQEMSHL